MTGTGVQNWANIEHIRDAVVVNFTRREALAEPSVESLAADLFRLIEESRPQRLILNLGNIEQITSIALGQLIALSKNAKTSGCQLVLYNLNTTIREILQVTQMDRLLTIDEGSTSPSILGVSAPHFTQATVTTGSSLAAPAGLKEVALYDPDPRRAADLIAVLAPRLSVVHFHDIETLERYCQSTSPAAVALAFYGSGVAPVSYEIADSPLLRFIRSQGRRLPITVYLNTSAIPIEAYCRALAAGAKQVINDRSPSLPEDLCQLVLRLIHDREDQQREEAQISDQFAEHGLHGRSGALLEVFRRAIKASRFSDLPVLIVGETGTGKQRLAEAIHALDPRRCSRSLLTINCSAVSKSLAESELFGHARGAFTGAEQERPGLFRAADGGTLLLDEIGDLNLELQPKLLRVLQERRLLPVGADYEHSLDIRIIAATNQPLEKMVAEGRFRPDLFQRLNVFHIFIPPLRDRPEDIEVQARHFLELYQSGRPAPVKEFGPRVLEALRLLPWEGNSRQLQSLLREALAHKEHGTSLDMEDLPGWVFQTLATLPSNGSIPHGVDAQVVEALRRHLPLNHALDEYECRLVQQALRDNGGNRTRAAAELGITPRTIFNKIKKYRLD